MTFLLIPLDEAIVFPGVTVTLPIDTAEEDRVFLLPRQNGEFGRIGVVAEVIERAQLPNGQWAATVVGLQRGLRSPTEPMSCASRCRRSTTAIPRTSAAAS